MYLAIPQGSKVDIQVGTKVCRTCNTEKSISNFELRKDRPNPYYRRECKECWYKRHVEWKERTGWSKKVWRERKEYKKKYRSNNIRYAESRVYYLKNKEKILEYNREYAKKRRADDPQFRVRKSISNRIRKVLKNKKGSLKTLELLGCSYLEFKLHIEAKFTYGMNWSNYGKNGWHLDHKTPISSFDLSKLEDIKKAFHYTNIQPLWEFDNLSKGDKLINV